MGLDIVELVVEIEKFFNINIKNEDAEHIYTLQDAVVCVARYLNVENENAVLKEQVTTKVLQALSQLEPRDISLHNNAAIFTILNPEDHQSWQRFTEKLGLIAPKPSPQIKSWFSKVFSDQRTRGPEQITLSQFVDVVSIANYRSLINGKKPADQHDIYIAVAGISQRISGIDIYEISPDKSFTEDLGMD